MELGYEIVSTGGTAKVLREAGISVTEVSELTNFPELMDGRLKTLHPKVAGGLLARRNNEQDMRQAEEHGIGMIDVLACNLYDFAGATAQPGVTLAEAIEQIDIGGPTMIRAAAKNAAHVMVVTDPADYGQVLHCLRDGDESTQHRLRLIMQATAFALTAVYDRAISVYLETQVRATAQ